MPRCIPTGKPASPNPHPLAQMPAMQAGATFLEIVEAGATYGRCITSQAEHSSSPDTPMTKGRLRSPLDPIDHRPPVGCRQGFRALNHEHDLEIAISTCTEP